MKRLLTGATATAVVLLLAGCSSGSCDGCPTPGENLSFAAAISQTGALLLVPVAILFVIGLIIHLNNDLFSATKWYIASGAVLVVAMICWGIAIWLGYAGY